MPTYDYRCNACGHEFEQFQSITAPVMRKCPECGRLKLERLIGTGAGVIFKGGGFYETDYRSEGYRKAAEAEKAGGSANTAKSDGAAASSDKSTESSSTPAPAKSGDAGTKKTASESTPKRRKRSSGD